MGRKKRAPCCDSSQVKKGPWSEAEDEKLKHYILRNGHDNWRMLPQLAGLRRCGKSCRLRWLNYLRPGLKRGDFTEEEEDAIVQLHHTLGNRWSKIAGHFPGRTDNEIKNVWNTRIKKRLVNSSPSSSSEVTNSQASSAYSSSASLVSLVCNDVANSEKQTQEEQFQKILEDMACGFEMNAPQSLEFLFKDPNIPPPPPTSQAESLAVHIESAGNDFWSQMLEPGLDDYNEWLNYLDNHT